MNRVALFAHFDSEDEIKPYVVYFLARLRESCSRIVFVSTARLFEREITKVRPYVAEVLLRENVGLDFGMWRHAVQNTNLDDTDELVLTNSSLFGPVYPLNPLFRRMSEDRCDFWGMTDNFEYSWHLQSYFLVLKRSVLSSPAFGMFWSGVLPLRDKKQIILSYEVGLTSFLVENGFVPGAFVPIESWAPWFVRRRMDVEHRWNTTFFHPLKLLALGMPFVKVTLLRDNPGNVALGPVYEAMKAAGYDTDLIEFDRPPQAPGPWFRAWPRRLRASLTSREREGSGLSRSSAGHRP